MDNATTTTITPAVVPSTATSTAPSEVHAAAPAGANHEEVTYNPKTPEPQIINGVKVFPTSYIPAKAVLHLPKKMLVEMQDWHIEGIHIVIFFALTIGLFIGMWKRPNLR